MEDRNRITRLHTLLVVCLVLFAVLLGRMVYLQLWRGDYYAKQSDGNRLRQSRILAPRGIIYDSEGKELVNNLPGYAVVLQKQSSYKPETLQRLSNLLQMPVEEINAKIKASENFYEPIMLKNNLDQQMVTKIEEQRRYMPEVMLSVQPIRNYPYHELAVHALGYVGEVSAYEIEQGLFKNITQGSLVGKAGLEKTYDKYLRGEDGAFMEEVDVAGNVVKHYDSVQPVPGKNLKLTIDYELQKELEEAEKTSETEEKEDTLLRDKVTEEEISRIVARWTGIPVAKLMEGEREKLLHLEDILHRRVIGQDEAVTKVSDAILRSRAGIRDPKRPIGSFLFLGPTGVGKTELAKALAEALFDDEHNIVRIDMSEYMEKYSVSRLIGAPPGYVGYEEGGQLTEAVRRRPYSVVLFDEVEKAHPDVFNVLLQVLDDGRITDSQGRTVDFKNTIIILTSNLGSDLILEGIGENGEISEEARDGVTQLLRRSFRPEFLNRLDEIVFYKPLTKENIRGIVDLLVADLQKRMAQRQLTVTLTDAAKDYLIAKGYDPIYGARPLKRLIQTEVETLLARWIIAEDPAPETAITVDYDGEKLVAM